MTRAAAHPAATPAAPTTPTANERHPRATGLPQGPPRSTGGGSPVDPRLLRTARAVRVHLVVSVVCGAALTGLIVLQAWLLARAVSDASDGATPTSLAPLVAGVAGVALARAVLAYGAESAALAGAARAKSQLRMRLVRHLAARPPSPDGPGAGETVALATRGLDALDDWFARYLPQLVLAVLVPVAVLVVIAEADWVSALVVAVTLPLIPVFMALVGMHTDARVRRHWRMLARLGGHFLDVVQGLPTLALFRRAGAVAAQVRETTDEHRRATMETLRVAFLSAFVLEVLATLAVALVAVEVGLRLLAGNLDYETALLVLILAPEAYLPLREVGARYHASAEGVAAARQVFDVLDGRDGRDDRDDRDDPNDEPNEGALRATALPEGPPRSPLRPAVSGTGGTGLALRDVVVRYPGSRRPALDGLTLTVAPGEAVLLRGPSGAGKSTLLSVLLRFTDPASGTLRVGGPDHPDGPDLRELDPDTWRRTVAWVPQHPHLFAGSLADNIRLGEPDAPDAAVRRAAGRAGLDAVAAALPDGYDTPLGEDGARLSSGERQRVALARAFLRDAPLVLLDEPTAHLDPDTAAAVRAAAAELLRGRTALVVAHDDGWPDLTHRTVTLPTPEGPHTPPHTGPLNESPSRAARPAESSSRSPGPTCTPTPAPAGRLGESSTRADRLDEGSSRSERAGGDGGVLGAVLRPRVRQVVAGATLGALATTCGAGLLALAGWLLATAATHPPITALSVAVVLTRALGVGRGVARYLERLVTHDAALRALADARNRVYARLAATGPVRRFRSGDLVTRLVSDTDAVQDAIVRGVVPPVAAVLAGSGAVLLAGALLLPGGALLAAGLLVAGVGVPLLAARAGRGPARRAARERARLSTALVDALHGAPDLIAYGAMDRAVGAVARCDDRITRVARRDARLLGLGAGASALVAGLTLAGALLLGVAAVEDGSLGPVPMAVLVLTALAAFEIVAPLPAPAARAGATRAGLRRLDDLLTAPSGRATTGPARSEPPAPLPPGGDLRIRGLTVAYPEPGRGDRTAARRTVLDGLDLDVPEGTCVALVGPSGSGKSTLAGVLFGFLGPDEVVAGSVTLGGTERRGGTELLDRDPDAVRTRISGVPQDPHVFDSTVRENLRLARPDAGDPELRAVLDRVGLGGLALDDPVGTHGRRLSGGMRRRIAVARALLADPAVLVLDEPTAHLDPDTRDALLDDVLGATRGRSVLLITHDPACLRYADVVHRLPVGGRNPREPLAGTVSNTSESPGSQHGHRWPVPRWGRPTSPTTNARSRACERPPEPFPHRCAGPA